MTYHKDKYGNRTLIKDLETEHLRNIIRWLERKAEEGITVCYGGGADPDDYWYELEELFGDDALKNLNQ